MRHIKPPRDWVSQAGGAGAAILLLAGLGYAFAGPAARLVAQPLTEVWVTIVRTPPDKVPPRLYPLPIEHLGSVAPPAPRPH
jgi:hypothetical protein